MGKRIKYDSGNYKKRLHIAAGNGVVEVTPEMLNRLKKDSNPNKLYYTKESTPVVNKPQTFNYSDIELKAIASLMD